MLGRQHSAPGLAQQGVLRQREMGDQRLQLVQKEPDRPESWIGIGQMGRVAVAELVVMNDRTAAGRQILKLSR